MPPEASRTLLRPLLLMAIVCHTSPTLARPLHEGGTERPELVWLEDMRSPAVLEWARERDTAARAYAASFKNRDAIEQRIREASDYRRFTAPIERGGRYFYTSFDPGLAKVSLHVRSGVSGPERTLIDGDQLARDEAKALFRMVAPSPDGKLVA